MSDPAPGAASGAPPADEGLERAIRLPHATAMVAGTIIGASIFVQPSEVTGSVPTPAGAALVWTAAGVLTLLGALVTAELAALLPRSGGVYVFLREGIGAWLGFLWGWAMFWVMHTGIIAAVAMIFARYTGFLMPLGPAGTTAVALAAVAALSAVNYAGVRYGANLQALFTLVKVAAIVLIVAVGFALGGDGQGAAAPAVSGAASQGLWGGADAGDFMLALMAGLFAFGGWHMVTYNAGETVDPERTIPRALAWGVAVVTLCYVALNAVYFRVLPIETVVASDRVAADAAEALLGRPGGVAVTVLVLFSTFGALAGIVLAGPRVYWAMARDGLLFRWAGTLHPRFRTPHRAILLQAAWAAVLILTGTYRALFTRVVYTEWIFFGMMAVGLFVLRARGRGRGAATGGYRAWGYPFTPALFAAAAFAIVIHQVVSDPAEAAVGLGLVLAGLPVYLWWRRGPEPRAAPRSRTPS